MFALTFSKHHFSNDEWEILMSCIKKWSARHDAQLRGDLDYDCMPSNDDNVMMFHYHSQSREYTHGGYFHAGEIDNGSTPEEGHVESAFGVKFGNDFATDITKHNKFGRLGSVLKKPKISSTSSFSTSSFSTSSFSTSSSSTSSSSTSSSSTSSSSTSSSLVSSASASISPISSSSTSSSSSSNNGSKSNYAFALEQLSTFLSRSIPYGDVGDGLSIEQIVNLIRAKALCPGGKDWKDLIKNDDDDIEFVTSWISTNFKKVGLKCFDRINSRINRRSRNAKAAKSTTKVYTLGRNLGVTGERLV